MNTINIDLYDIFFNEDISVFEDNLIDSRDAMLNYNEQLLNEIERLQQENISYEELIETLEIFFKQLDELDISSHPKFRIACILNNLSPGLKLSGINISSLYNSLKDTPLFKDIEKSYYSVIEKYDDEEVKKETDICIYLENLEDFFNITISRRTTPKDGLDKIKEKYGEVVKLRQICSEYIELNFLSEKQGLEFEKLTTTEEQIAYLNSIIDSGELTGDTDEKIKTDGLMDVLVISKRYQKQVYDFLKPLYSLTTYLKLRGLPKSAGSSYITNSRAISKKMLLYLAFYIGISTPEELEHFMNLNDYTMKSPVNLFCKNSLIWDRDIMLFLKNGVSHLTIEKLIGYYTEEDS